MTWVKVDVNFPDHPKVVPLSDSALALWLRGLCYASRYLTDGAIHEQVLLRLSSDPDVVDELHDAGLWQPTNLGWQIVNYSEHQRTRAEVEEFRRSKSEAGSKGNHDRWHTKRGLFDPQCPSCVESRSQTDRTSIAPAIANGSQNDRKPIADIDIDTDTEEELFVTSDDVTDDGFDAFWQAYPRRNGQRLGKKKAHAAWKRLPASKRPDAQRACDNYRRACDGGQTIARDAERFLRDDWWEGWLAPVKATATVLRDGMRGTSQWGEPMEVRYGKWGIIRDGQWRQAENPPVEVAS